MSATRRRKTGRDGDGDSQKAAKRVKTETGTCVIWQWQGDGEIWKDYSSDLAKEISNAFSKGDQKTAFTIGASKFEVIFGQMVQRNVKTGWERNIRVKPDNDYDSVTPDALWQWEDETGKWNTYADDVQRLLYAAECCHVNEVDVPIQGRKFQLNLEKEEQISKTKIRKGMRAEKVTTAAPTSSAASSAESATQSNKLAVQPQAEEATPGTSSGKTSAEGTDLNAKASYVPVDQELPPRAKNRYHVYSEGEDIWDAMLNQTDIKANHNKFYLLQLLQDNNNKFAVWFRWGRVGLVGQSNLVDCGSDFPKAKKEFTKKFTEKTKNKWENRKNFKKVQGKYDLLDMDYSSSSSAQVAETPDVLKSIETALGPTGSIAQDVVDFNGAHEEEYPYAVGDKLSFSGLENNEDFKFIEGRVVAMPDYDDRDEDVYGECDTQLDMMIHADARKYKVDKKKDKERLQNELAKWFDKGGRRRKEEEGIKILNLKAVRTEDRYYILSVTVICVEENVTGLLGEVTESVFREQVWNKHMDRTVKEGVCYSDSKVPPSLRESLRRNIEGLANSTPVDYHPNSNDIVRDLVHPALFPYVKGVSKFRKGCQLPEQAAKGEGYDFWGRPYEDSKFQWLPAPFNVSAEGKCSILKYINNLDRNRFPALYKDLEDLFEIFLPYFQEVWSYAKAMEFFNPDEDDVDEDKVKHTIKKKPVSFSGRELQVITKIVDYTLQPQQSYEGVWHAEGMSHENIVMTGIYFLDRDPDIQGGDLKFKRAFTMAERTEILYGIPQGRPRMTDEFADEGFVPLGRFPTKEGYILVFPNSHIHKISKMVNTASEKVSSRRIVVFFFVNPEKKIISTREVLPQQNVIGLDAAKKYRLQLMAERKYDKEKLNVRGIELCEH